MKTKKLHELIELAKAGKKFRASIGNHCVPFSNETFLNFNEWTTYQVMEQWIYEEIVELEIVEIESMEFRRLGDFKGAVTNPDLLLIGTTWCKGPNSVDKLRGKKWKVRFEEII